MEVAEAVAAEVVAEVVVTELKKRMNDKTIDTISFQQRPDLHQQPGFVFAPLWTVPLELLYDGD